jgi:hypothetical protein
MSGGARIQTARLRPTLVGWNVTQAMGVEATGSQLEHARCGRV